MAKARILVASGPVAGAMVLGLGAVAFCGSLAGVAGALNPRLDLFAHFAPVWLVAGVLALALAGPFSRGRVRLTVLFVGLFAVAAAGVLIAPEWSRPIDIVREGPGVQRLRLIQFNTWDQNLEPDVLATWVSQANPDVVTVEESTPALKRALESHGFHWVRGMVTTAVYSRGLRSGPKFMVPRRDWKLLPDFARAGFLTAGGAPFTVVTVHLNWPNLIDSWNKPKELERLLENQPKARLIVSGDFNLTPWSSALRRMDGRLGLLRRDRAIPTWPATRRVAGVLLSLPAILPIDHVYAGPAWRTVSVTRGPNLGSDHYPLIVDLTLASDGLCRSGAMC